VCAKVRGESGGPGGTPKFARYCPASISVCWACCSLLSTCCWASSFCSWVCCSESESAWSWFNSFRIQLILGVVKLILLLFLLLLLLRLRGVEVVIVIGWRDVVAIPGEVLQRLHRRREVLGKGAGRKGRGIGTGGGIGPSWAESSVPADTDATAISLVPGGKTSTNASAAMIAGTATTACSRRERLRARTAALTSQRLIRRSTPVAIAHSAAVSGDTAQIELCPRYEHITDPLKLRAGARRLLGRASVLTHWFGV
jgi:hypothetical protein